MRNTPWSPVPTLILATILVACSSDEPAVPDAAAPPAPDTTEVAAPNPTPNPDSAPFAPITSRDRGATGSQITAPGAKFTLPGTWISEPPSSSMRLAQARIPGPAGDAQMTAFYFGAGGGGGVESNLQRWIGQVEAAAEPERDTFSVGEFTVTWVAVAGTIKPSTMGTGPNTPQPNSRLLAAVVEGRQGPWFFKATGPAETLEAERDAFLAMLKSAVPHG